MMMSTRAERGERITTKDGLTFQCTGDERYRVGARVAGFRRAWRGCCKQCGRPFTFYTPADGKPHFARLYCDEHKTNKTDGVFGSSAVGAVVVHDMQQYRCEAILTVTRRDGALVEVRQWSAGCRACGAPFTFTAGAGYGTPRRNCDIHKRMARDVFA